MSMSLKKRVAGTLCAAIVSSASSVALTASPAYAATSRPDFKLPVPCATTWQATTYDYYGNIPHLEAVDLNMVTENGGYLEDGGQPVLSASGGRVVPADVRNSGEVKIDHGGGWVTRYLHMQNIRVDVGQILAPGQQIGEVGSVGLGTGPHLHFELWQDGRMVRPVFDGEQVTWNRTSGERQATRLFRSTNCLAGRGAGPAYAGKLIRHPNGTIDYVAYNGSRYWVPNMAVANCLESPVHNVSDAVFNSMPRNRQGENGMWADCNTKYVNRLVKAPDGTVDYLDATGARSWVPSDAVVACLGGWGSVRDVDWATFNLSPRNPYGRHADCSTAQVGRPIREPGGTIDFVSAKGSRYWVPSGDVVRCLGPDSQVVEVTPAAFTRLPRNASAKWASCNTELFNRLIRRQDGTVDYVTSTGLRYWVPNQEVIKCLGGWSTTVYVNDARFAGLPRNPSNAWATCATKQL